MLLWPFIPRWWSHSNPSRHRLLCRCTEQSACHASGEERMRRKSPPLVRLRPSCSTQLVPCQSWSVPNSWNRFRISRMVPKHGEVGSSYCVPPLPHKRVTSRMSGPSNSFRAGRVITFVSAVTNVCAGGTADAPGYSIHQHRPGLALACICEAGPAGEGARGAWRGSRGWPPCFWYDSVIRGMLRFS